MLRAERDALMKPSPLAWVSTENVAPLDVAIAGWEPTHAERRYLDRLGQLT
jgi:hypothetical protein